MNAIIALCHFCDHHGPTTIFCTQAFKYTDLYNKNALLFQQQQTQEIELEESSSIISSLDQSQFTNDLQTNKHHQIDTSLTINNDESSCGASLGVEKQTKIVESTTTTTTTTTTRKSSSCKACRVFNKGFQHYISYEDYKSDEGVKAASANEAWSPNRICYISQSSPNDSEVFALVRKACLRTLHCEVFEDPIYFDDDKNGSVIGYEFNIKDCEGDNEEANFE
jgi:folliculin